MSAQPPYYRERVVHVAQCPKSIALRCMNLVNTCKEFTFSHPN